MLALAAARGRGWGHTAGQVLLVSHMPTLPSMDRVFFGGCTLGKLVVSRDPPLLLTSGWRGAARAMLGAVLG